MARKRVVWRAGIRQRRGEPCLTGDDAKAQLDDIVDAIPTWFNCSVSDRSAKVLIGRQRCNYYLVFRMERCLPSGLFTRRAGNIAGSYSAVTGMISYEVATW